MDGVDWDTDLGFLSGRLVTVHRCMLNSAEPRWIEHEGLNYDLSSVDPTKNAHRICPPSCLDKVHESKVPFDPAKALLDKALCR